MNTNRLPRLATVIAAVAAAPILLAAARGTTPTQTPPASNTTTIVVKIKGAKQGDFKSEQVVARNPNEIPGFGFQLEAHSPRDPITGSATGKRQYTPVTFTKQWGAASPQILQALSTNETLLSVEFDFSRPNALGQETVYYTIKLTNATVASVRSYIGSVGAPGSGAEQRALEDVSFTFQKIEVEDKEGKTSAMDDWRSAT